MPRTIADDVYSALCTLSVIERQILQLRDQLTALLASAHVPDTQQEASPPTRANVTCVAEEAAFEPLAQDTTGINLERWLFDRGFTIKQKRAAIAFDPTFDRLAKQLGDNYDSVCLLYSAIKRRFGPLSPPGISLKGLAPQQIGLVVSFGNQLLRNGLLKEFRYDRKLKTVTFETQKNGQVQNFFTGGWFERYVFLCAKNYLARSHSASEITALLNPKITLPDGQDFELDILIGTASVVLWLECKTGRDYPAYATRYQEIATKHMRMSPLHSALVLLEPLTDEQKRNTSSVAGMSVLNLPDLGHFLTMR